MSNEHVERHLLVTMGDYKYIWYPALKTVERRKRGGTSSITETEIRLRYNNNTEAGAVRAALKDLEKILSARIEANKAQQRNN